jgi:hypothetical protein
VTDRQGAGALLAASAEALASTRWRALTRRQAFRLERLAGRDPRTLAKAELVELEGLATWALYCGDDGDYIYDDDGDDQLERDDLSDEEREWLHAVLRAVWDELQRREHVRQALRTRATDPSSRDVRHDRQPERRTIARVRPREHRARPIRSGGGSRDRPRPSADDDDDLAPRAGRRAA